MARDLPRDENASFGAYSECGMPLRATAAKLGRSRTVVLPYLYNRKKKPGVMIPVADDMRDESTVQRPTGVSEVLESQLLAFLRRFLSLYMIFHHRQDDTAIHASSTQ